MLLKKLFYILLTISLMFLVYAQNDLESDEYINTATSTRIVGLPYASFYFDEQSNLLLITHLSSTGQKNQYVCFRTACSEGSFSIKLNDQTIPFIKYTTGTYCIDANEIGSCTYCSILYALCGNQELERMAYQRGENTLYDIYFESDNILASFIDPQGVYANEVYYTNLSPGETMDFNLYIRDITTNSPWPLLGSQPYDEKIFVRESYSLQYINTLTSKGKCVDNTCLKYSLTFPTIGVPQKSLFLISKIILDYDKVNNPPEAEYCGYETTKNNCISKVILLHPMPYKGNLIIEGSQRNDGTYYYGQKINISLTDYEEHTLGDGGSINAKYVLIYNNEGIIDKIDYDPITAEAIRFDLKEEFKNTKIGIKYVMEYETPFGEIIYYNQTQEINVNDEFAYEIKSLSSLENYTEAINISIDEIALLPGAYLKISIEPYLEDRDGNKEKEFNYSLSLEGLYGSNKKYNVHVINKYEENGKNIYEVFLPNNITDDIIQGYISYRIEANIYGKDLTYEGTIPLPPLFSGITSVSAQEAFIGESVNLKANFNEATNVKLKNVFLIKNNKEIEIEDIMFDTTPYNFSLEVEIPEKEDIEGKNILVVLLEINGKKSIYTTTLDIMKELPGYNIVVYEYKEKSKIRYPEKTNISFEHIYDMVKEELIIKNVGTKNIDLNKLTIKINNITLPINNGRTIKSKDQNDDILSPQEEYRFFIIFDPVVILSNKLNTMKIYAGKTLLSSITLQKQIKNPNKTFDIQMTSKEILYNPNTKKARAELEINTNIDNLGVVGFELSIYSDECKPKKIYESSNEVVFKKPGTKYIDIEIESNQKNKLEKIIKNCKNNAKLVVIAKRYEYNKSLSIGVEEFDVLLKSLEESSVSELKEETLDLLKELSDLCEEEFLDKCDIDKEEVCDTFIKESRNTIKDLDLTLDDDVKTLQSIYTNVKSYKSKIISCKINIERTQNYTETIEEFNEVYSLLCANEDNKNKIIKKLKFQEQIDFENACKVYEKIYYEKSGDMSLYEEAINELKPYEQYLYIEEEPTPYGKIFLVLVILLILVGIVAYVIVKYLPSKEKVEVKEEDLYEI